MSLLTIRIPAIIAALVILVAAPACDEDHAPAATSSATTATGGTSTPTVTLPTATLSPTGTSQAPASATTSTSTPVRTPSLPPPTVTQPPRGTPSPSPSVTATPSPSATPTTVQHVPGTLGAPMRLSPGVEADLGEGRSLAFLAVTGDSRCPADVQCVWAGEATLQLEWTEPGQLQRVALVAAPATGSVALPNGYRLRLLSLEPAPRSTRAIAQSEYVATVVVEAGTAQAASGVFGTVRVGPSCPVQRESAPCPDRPLSATLVFRNPAGTEVARTLSDSAGFYSVALPAGKYTIVPFTPGGATLPRGVEQDIEVPVSQWITADVSYDSGIR